MKLIDLKLKSKKWLNETLFFLKKSQKNGLTKPYFFLKKISQFLKIK